MNSGNDARSGPAAVELRDVTVHYQDVSKQVIRVLDGLRLAVAVGRMVCLSGRSGSGKTTALMVAAGLLRPTSGLVRWGDLEITGLSADEATRERGRRIGLVFQNAALVASLRARENVALAGMSGNGAPQGGRAEELLTLLGLADRAEHFPSQLSGGEQQRVALARALFRDPPLLLVDEPTANLDRRTASGIVDLLGTLRSQGRALLVASHDEAVLTRADSIVQLE